MLDVIPEIPKILPFASINNAALNPKTEPPTNAFSYAKGIPVTPSVTAANGAARINFLLNSGLLT